MTVSWRDNQARYGTVTRIIHWLMAALIGWQFLGMILRAILGRSPVAGFFVGTHASIGSLLLVLAIIRIVWGLCQRSSRPPYERNLVGRLAALGHLGLYGLLFLIPAVAVLRAIGSGRGLQFFGLQLYPATGEQIAWLMQPANLIHGKLAWLMLALIVGHIAMVIVHTAIWKDGTLQRMAGRK